MLSKSYPIAETFTSVQGEGVYTGTLMHFIRLAGCNVGQYVNVNGASIEGLGAAIFTPADFPLIDTKKHSVCTSILGQRFLCDTNYHKCYDATVEELMQRAGLVEHICITGGEPFLHDLDPLIDGAAQRMVHIETSGTKPIPWSEPRSDDVWITCSPKAGFLPSNIHLIDEWKFVVSSVDDIRKVALFVDTFNIGYVPNIYLQPINWVDSINEDGINMVLSQLEYFPKFRLSAQLHKYLGVR